MALYFENWQDKSDENTISYKKVELQNRT